MADLSALLFILVAFALFGAAVAALGRL